MRSVQRMTNALKQFQTCLQIQHVMIAIVGDGLALDQLHHHIGSTVLGAASVDESGDAGMLEIGQNLALGGKSLQCAFADGALQEQLDRHFLLECTVGTTCAIDRTHASASQLSDQFIAADALAGHHGIPGMDRTGLKEIGTGDFSCGQAQHGSQQYGTVSTLCLEPLRTAGFRLIQILGQASQRLCIKRKR
ncbi:MAG: hypothetical protein ABIY56_01010 [Dokdonella sp.]